MLEGQAEFKSFTHATRIVDAATGLIRLNETFVDLQKTGKRDRSLEEVYKTTKQALISDIRLFGGVGEVDKVIAGRYGTLREVLDTDSSWLPEDLK